MSEVKLHSWKVNFVCRIEKTAATLGQCILSSEKAMQQL